MTAILTGSDTNFKALLRDQQTAVNALSLIIIAFLSHTWLTPLVLIPYSLATYAVIRFAIENSPHRKLSYALFVGGHVAAFALFQHLGWIGILNVENLTHPRTLAYLLGLSFYFLQVIVVAGLVYRREMNTPSIGSYFLIITFFGNFLAGPLFNRKQILALQTTQIRFPDFVTINENMHLMIGGLVFKFVFANWLGQWVHINEVSSPLEIARSVVCFELQVYFDFAGYSLAALTLCRWFAVPTYYNFDHPFAARDIPEFWRRWHIGLGLFFKENVFVPLRELFGHEMTKTLFPLFIFLISAAWHGPTMNFLVWGLFHGLAFIFAVNVLSKIPVSALRSFISKIFVLGVIFFGRLLFMDSNFQRLTKKLQVLQNFSLLNTEIAATLSPASLIARKAGLALDWSDYMIAFFILAVLGYELFAPKAWLEKRYRYFRPGWVSLVIFAIFLLLLQPGTKMSFVYGR